MSRSAQGSVENRLEKYGRNLTELARDRAWTR